MKGIEYRGMTSVDGPIVIVRRTENIFYLETVCVRDRNGNKRIGRVMDLSEDAAVVQIFGNTTGLDLDATTYEFLDTPLELRVGEGLLGRIFNGLGEPIDGYPPIVSSELVNINGNPINPYARIYPRDFIQTGISAIDGMNSLVRGQKLPIFSGNGLPHNKLAAQIIRQAKLRSSDEQFVMVFAGMGIKYDIARFFTDTFEESGVLSKVVMFQSLADAPSIERIITPRCALTAAEYLAFKKGMHVLVVLTDMTNYCEALREISTTRGEVPGRKGYPGYLYSDLAELYDVMTEEGEHSFEAHIERGLDIMGNRQLIAQAITNLLDNAVKYTPSGGHITLTAEQRGENIHVSVGDNGHGIPPDKRDDVLKRFVRLDSARSTPGNGLGLSLVSAIVALHNGSLTLHDNKPGLRIEITLPSETAYLRRQNESEF